ncbi:cystathionine gamma-synthase [Pseudorhizobium flavum]|uniref:cystathionine gamma-synthase n=1 Tax=Pseudorhizobium flavum TaxID=1335061 RepID=UPI00376FCAD2
MRKQRPETIAASRGIGEDRAFGAVNPPLFLSSTYTFSGYATPGQHEYSRTSNPTRSLLAETIAELEGGTAAIITSSGMAALNLVLSLLRPSDLMIAPHDCYGGSYRLIQQKAERGHFRVRFLDQNDPEALALGLGQRPKLVLVETPSNPLMRIVDIAALATAAHEVGALLAVDNTFLSPALQTPIALGADLVVHSTTKYLNGHSDVIGGAVVAASASEGEQLDQWANITGVTGSAFDAYLILRGIRTLHARLDVQQRNAAAIAAFLSSHPAVERVHYPGLHTHPGHSIAKAQQRGYGAMLSFELKGGVAEVRHFVESVKVFTLAESLGGIESLVAHPATMTHLGMGAEARAAAGISDSLIRLSVGLEAEDDLIDDLGNALSNL